MVKYQQHSPRGASVSSCFRVSVISVALWCVLVSVVCGAAESRFELKTEVGFGGAFKLGYWTPLRVTIINHDAFVGPVLLRVDLEVGCPSSAHGQPLRRFRTQTVLDGSLETQVLIGFRPSGSINKCWLYLLDGRPESEGGIAAKQVDALCSSGQCPMLSPAAMPKAERVLHAVSLNEMLMKAKSSYQSLYLLVNPSTALKEAASARGLFPNRGECPVAVCESKELTASAGLYESLDAIVLDRIGDASLSGDHAAALRDWVSGGGLLVLTRSCLESVWGESLLGLFPASARTQGQAVTVPWGEAAAYFGMATESAVPVETLALDLAPTYFTVRTGDVPLFALHGFALGHLALVPFHTEDICGSSGPDRRLQECVWSRALEPMYQRQGNYWDTQAGVPANITVRRLAFPYLLFVALSSLCLGPGCVLLVRARQRRIQVLWILPLVSILLCMGIFASALWMRGSRMRIEGATLLQGDVNGGRGLARDYFSLISGAPGMYSFGPLPADAVIRESNEGSRREAADIGLFPSMLDQGADGVGINALHMNRWSMRFFKVDLPADMPRLNGYLAAVDDGLSGWIQNDSEHRVEQASLVFKWNRVSLGDLAPGQRVDVKLTLNAPPETVRVFNPYYANFEQVSHPLNPAHWPDTPFSYEIVQLLDTTRILDYPSVLGLLPEAAAPAGLPRLEGEAYSRRGKVVGLWRFPVVAAKPQPPFLAPGGCVVRESYYDKWGSCFRVGQWSSAFSTVFPFAEARFDRPELILHTRLTSKSAKERTAQDEFRIRFFDWAAKGYSEQMTMTVGDMAIPEAYRYVRPGDGRILFSMSIVGPKANSYEIFELDRVDCSVSEAAP